MGRFHKKQENGVADFLAGKELHDGNDVIKRYICGEAKGRTQWIRYFYSDCTDERVINENCKDLFGGYNEDDAEGYVGAYTLLQRIPFNSMIYRAGFNYSFEQVSANYD